MTTRKQHFVPQFYLRNFCNTKDNSNCTDIYIISKACLRQNIPVKSICYEAYLYGDDGVIETNFSRLEAEWAINIRSLIDNNRHVIPKKQKESIYYFVAYQLIRTVTYQKYLLQSSEELKDIIKPIADKIFPKGVKFDFILSMIHEIYAEIKDLSNCIIDNNTDVFFLTSDNPCICTNIFSQHLIGLGLIGTVIFIPISSHKLLLLYDRKAVNIFINNYSIESRNFIDAINAYQFYNADKIVIGKVEALIIDDKLEKMKRIRATMRKKSYTMTMACEEQLLVATRNDFPEYFTQIPFLVLDKRLLVIDECSRYGITRKPEYKALRLNCLAITQDSDNSNVYKSVIKEYWRCKV